MMLPWLWHPGNLWKQLSDTLKNRSNDWVAYEFMNEPVAPEHEQWNQLVAKVHKALRELEPQRTLVIGSNMWQGHETMKYLKVPEGDKNIILSFHYYNPMLLTHYGAWWSPLCAAYKGKVNYPGVLVSKEDFDAAPAAIKDQLKPYTEEVWNIDKIREQLKDAIEAAKKYDLQLFCGEWGVYEPVDRELAYNWYRDVLTVFDEYNIGSAAPLVQGSSAGRATDVRQGSWRIKRIRGSKLRTYASLLREDHDDGHSPEAGLPLFFPD